MSLLVGTLMAVTASSALGLILSLIFGALTTSIAGWSLAAGALVGILIFRYAAVTCERMRFGYEAWIVLFLYSLFSLRQFLWIYFYRGGAMWTLDAYNIGDLPLHLTHIFNFVEGATFWPENPLMTGETMRYPFGVDLFAALWLKAGIPVERTLPLMGLAAAALLGFALFRWAGALGVAAFLFGGGAQNLAWKSLPLALWIPQRGFLFALPAGLLLLWAWRRRYLQKRPSMAILTEGVLWGCLPLFHVHTFLFISLIFVLWVIVGRRFRDGIYTFLWAVVPASLLVWNLTDGFQMVSLIWWKPGWLIGEENPLLFLWKNFGLMIPAVAIAVYAAWRQRSVEHAWLLGPGIVMFVALFFVMVSPWDWDNTKMMIWCYLIVLAPLNELLLKDPSPFLRILVFAALFYPGVYAVADSTGKTKGIQVADLKELDPVCQAVQKLNPEARFLTAPVYNHPVSLCGRKVVAGYGGHLWSHGIDSKEVDGRIRKLMSGDAAWHTIARTLGAGYLYWGPREEREFPGSKKPWENKARRLAHGDWGALYDIT
ncbi:MAG: hypothetical protein Q8R76_05620 [Candidatus Omnitrophota bacterium]|nr:hypothetical protein [Candidatus Omnitrophota bacterium]